MSYFVLLRLLIVRLNHQTNWSFQRQIILVFRFEFADLSLYEAKETGRNKVVKFTKELLKNADKDKY